MGSIDWCDSITVTLIVPKSALGPQDEKITSSICLAVIHTQTWCISASACVARSWRAKPCGVLHCRLSSAKLPVRRRWKLTCFYVPPSRNHTPSSFDRTSARRYVPYISTELSTITKCTKMLSCEWSCSHRPKYVIMLRPMRTSWMLKS